ncbi:hypothetical protein EJ08DRAFT_418987 [Tothia fuscella]|uniref:Uncharacterized protein n=1 Tax=Tothia fuscella TaxID=1048955 RepID=A0A9P4NJP3_9PEZI|nr:hypothetical protein EJ08DRAFT_418987 [Tothia fuscella]
MPTTTPLPAPRLLPRKKGSRTSNLVALLSLTTLTSAVSLSDFSPLLNDLPSACNDAYYTTIPGCTVADFSASRNTCTKACLSGLVQINALVSTTCADADVEETSIVGLFKLGKAIQLLCNVAVVTTTTGLGVGGGAGGRGTVTMSMTSKTASIGQSTMILSSIPPVTSGLVTDTSVQIKPSSTSIALSTTPTITTSATPTTSSILVDTSSKTSTTTTSKTSPSSDAAQSQRSGDRGSGGGSPFDNIDNSSASSLHTIRGLIGSSLVAIILGAYLF